MKMKRALLFFVDGFGIGKEEKSNYNPIETGNLPVLQELLSREEVIPTDAILGVPGLPQSASGQTTILTGINAPKAIGRHLNGFPNAELRKIIEKENIFIKLQSLDLKVTNANAYNKNFMSKFSNNPKAMEEMSVSTVATLSAGLSLYREEDLKKGAAVYQDLTNKIIIDKWKAKVPIRTPEKAGENLAKIVNNHHFTFFEYFQTDLAGHRKDFENAYFVLENLVRFIGSLLEFLCLENTLFIFVSDHGNIEDLSTADHTNNMVPTIVLGNESKSFRRDIKSIQDITPNIIQYFSRKPQTS